MTLDEIIKLIQTLAPALTVYVAVRVDLATLTVRMTRAEVDIQELRHRAAREMDSRPTNGH